MYVRTLLNVSITATFEGIKTQTQMADLKRGIFLTLEGAF